MFCSVPCFCKAWMASSVRVCVTGCDVAPLFALPVCLSPFLIVAIHPRRAERRHFNEQILSARRAAEDWDY